MKAFRIRYENGSFEIKLAKDALSLIRQHDLASRKHVNTRIIELSGEQEAIAFSNQD